MDHCVGGYLIHMAQKLMQNFKLFYCSIEPWLVFAE
jgi:hypothetical protein